MLLLLVRKPHVRRIDSLAGLERPQTAASTTGPSGWGCSTAGFSCRGCLPEFLHLRSISLIRMAWDSSLPRAHGIQWEHIQCCAEDSPLLFKGRTLILVPQPCSLPTSQSLITPIWEAVTCTLYLECHVLLCHVSVLWLVKKRKLGIGQHQQYLSLEGTD